MIKLILTQILAASVLFCSAQDTTMIGTPKIVHDHYTVSGGLLGAANFSKFRVTDNSTVASSYKFEPGWSAGIWLNFPLGNAFSLEPQAMYSMYGYSSSLTTPSLLNDGSLSFISVPVLFKFHLGPKFALDLGPQVDFFQDFKDNRNNAKKSDFTSTSWSVFGGFELFPHDRVTIFGRYIHGLTNMDNTGNPNTVGKFYNQNFQAGVKVKLFGKHVPADSDGDGVIDAKDTCPVVFGLARYDGCPIPDSDKDGINDEMDKCPNVEGLQRYQGCPIPDTDKDGVNDEMDKCPTVAGLAKYQGCPIPDTDGDGINDEEDKCPAEKGVAKYQGCPIKDSDGDGINDDEDKCPLVAGTAALNGCPEIKQEIIKKVTIAAENIQFATGKATLLKSSFKGLDNVVDALNQYPDVKMDIDGHTDNVGKAEFNQKLSQQRADAVKAYFVKKGIVETRMVATGHGMDVPLADNKTAKGRAKNRRVEMKLHY